MPITKTMHVIAVPDLERSAQYYEEVLGFEVHLIGDPGWRLYKKDHCRILAGHCPDAAEPVSLGDHSYFAYFIVDNIDDYYERVVKYDAELIKKINDEPWGMREFGVRTIDGHRIMIGQELDD